MPSQELVVLIGGTNSLAKALVKEYLSKKNLFKVIVTARDKNKFDDLYMDCLSEKLEFYELDVLKLADMDGLVAYAEKHKRKVTFYYLAAVKNSGSNDIENLFKINFLSSVHCHDVLLRRMADFNFILVGSQGDIHGTEGTSSYNASKSAMSKYFEPIAIMNKDVKKVFMVKPWIFQSKMIQTSAVKRTLSCSVEYIARGIIKGVDKNNSLIFVPAFTYKLIEVLSFFNKKFLYIILFKFMK